MMSGQDAEPVIRFSRGTPPGAVIPAGPLTSLAQEVVRSSAHEVFHYAPLNGFLGDEELRAHLADLTGRDADSIFVTNGSLQALDLVATHLLESRPGRVLVENPTYDRALRIFRRRGADVVGIPLQPKGIDVENVEHVLRSGAGVSFLYTIPDFQNPSGVTMDLERRARLLELAERYDFPIIEDSPYRHLSYGAEPPPALSTLDPDGETVVSINSLSKALAPGLRIGYVAAGGTLSRDLAKLSSDVYLAPSLLNQRIAGKALAAGLLAKTVDASRALIAPLRDNACKAVDDLLPGSLICYPGGGYFLGILVARQGSEQQLLDRAVSCSVEIVPGSSFCVRPQRYQFLRIPFQHLVAEDFTEGIRRLADALDHPTMNGR